MCGTLFGRHYWGINRKFSERNIFFPALIFYKESKGRGDRPASFSPRQYSLFPPPEAPQRVCNKSFAPGRPLHGVRTRLVHSPSCPASNPPPRSCDGPGQNIRHLEAYVSHKVGHSPEADVAFKKDDHFALRGGRGVG